MKAPAPRNALARALLVDLFLERLLETILRLLLRPPYGLDSPRTPNILFAARYVPYVSDPAVAPMPAISLNASSAAMSARLKLILCARGRSCKKTELVQYYPARSPYRTIIFAIMPIIRAAAIQRWVATVNNYTAAEYDSLITSSTEQANYAIIGKEVGETGTPHLQCFFIWSSRKRLRQVKLIPGLQRAHLEPAAGTSQQAAAYCKKEGDFWEHGTLPSQGPKTSIFETFRDWFKDQPGVVTERDILDHHPGILRYPHFIEVCQRQYGKRPTLVVGNPRTWQDELSTLIDGEPDDRKITFVVDEEGNKGKSWLTRYWFSNRDDIQMLSVGKRDDLAYAIDISKRVFVFDIPRGNMEYFQYSVVEALKNQMIMSNKYKSVTKIIPHKVHVVVFCNEEPDRNAMTRDRYQIKNITPLV